MMESKVFADNFSRSFSESGDFFQFLSARQARSKWMTAPSKELRFEPVERGSTLGNLYMQIYDHNGDADVLEDTMENTSLLLKVDGKDYPVRSCAIKTVLERARISGHALNKVSKTVFAEILNYCMGVASGDSLIKVADEKVSAVHGGDPKDYTVMEMLPLFKATNDFLDREYPGNRFMTAHFDHSIATAIWCLDGQADKLLDTYHREIAAKGLQTEKMVPALRFSTSDVGMSGANLYPIFLVGAESRIVPLGYSIRTEHKNGVDMQYFEEQLRLVYAQFEKALDKQVQLMNIEIRYPVTTLMRVLKRIKAPKKASYEAMDYFVAIHGDSPCTAYELFMQMSDVIFSAQCDGASGLRMYQHPFFPFLIADVDRFVTLPDGRKAILECKTAHYDMQFKWANGAVPRHYELQVRHYMSVMNIDVAFIACLFSNNENDFVWQKIERDLEEEENTIMELAAFWNNHVMARVEPPLVEKPDAVLESLRRYFGPADKSEPTVDLDRKFVVNLKEILALKEEKRALDAQVKALETRIKSLYAPIVEEMGTACKGTCEQGGECFKVSYNPLYREGISKDRLSALRAQYPDIYDEFVDQTESRIFKVVKSAIA